MNETQQQLVERLRKKHAEGLLLWELENGFEMSPKQSALVFETAKGILLEHHQMERGRVQVVGIVLGQSAGKRMHERGENEADIAKKTQHQLKSVGRYISHNTRVKQLMERGLDNKEIAHILGIGERVVQEYNRIAMHFHPELAKKVTLKKNKKAKRPTRGQLAL